MKSVDGILKAGDWIIEYDNDTGPDDDSFYEWWSVTNGVMAFKSDSEEDARWLCDILNAHILTIGQTPEVKP